MFNPQPPDLGPDQLETFRLPMLFLKNIRSEVIVSIAVSKIPGVVTLSSFIESYKPDARTEEMLYASFQPGVQHIRVMPLR